MVHSRVGREEVHVLVTFRIPDPDTLSLGEDNRKRMVARIEEVSQQRSYVLNEIRSTYL